MCGFPLWRLALNAIEPKIDITHFNHVVTQLCPHVFLIFPVIADTYIGASNTPVKASFPGFQ